MTKTPRRLRSAATLTALLLTLGTGAASAAKSQPVADNGSSTIETCVQSEDRVVAPVVCETEATVESGALTVRADARAAGDGTTPSRGRAEAVAYAWRTHHLKRAATKVTYTFHFQVTSASASVTGAGSSANTSVVEVHAEPTWHKDNCPGCTATSGKQVLATGLGTGDPLLDGSAGAVREVADAAVAGPQDDRFDLVVELTNPGSKVPRGDYALNGMAFASAQVGTDVFAGTGGASAGGQVTFLGVDIAVTP